MSSILHESYVLYPRSFDKSLNSMSIGFSVNQRFVVVRGFSLEDPRLDLRKKGVRGWTSYTRSGNRRPLTTTINSGRSCHLNCRTRNSTETKLEIIELPRRF